MEKVIYDTNNGLWYELQGDYYIPCLKLPDEEQVAVGVWCMGYAAFGVYQTSSQRILHVLTYRM